MNKIKFKEELTIEDMRLYYQSKFLHSKVFWLYYIVAVLYIVWHFYKHRYDYTRIDYEHMSIVFFVILVIPIGVLSFISSVAFRYYKERGAKDVEIDENGIHLYLDNSKTDICWTRYDGFREVKRYFLLYSKEEIRDVIYKKFLNDTQINDFRDFLKSKYESGE